jgi:hypothetical protein
VPIASWREPRFAHLFKGFSVAYRANCGLTRSRGTIPCVYRSKVLAATYNAVGGPKNPEMGEDGFMAGPTDAGRYRVARYGRHSSLRYRGWSTFLWRSPVKEEGGKVFVMHNGEWADVEK